MASVSDHGGKQYRTCCGGSEIISNVLTTVYFGQWTWPVVYDWKHFPVADAMMQQYNLAVLSSFDEL